MKHIILACLLLLCSSSLWASHDELVIKITNHSGADCVLQKQYILYGRLYGSQIREEIMREQTGEFKMRSIHSYYGAYDDKSIVLHYICGDNQAVRLFSHASPFQGMSEAEIAVLEANNIKATAHIRNNTGFKHQEPVEIHWTLTPSCACATS